MTKKRLWKLVAYEKSIRMKKGVFEVAIRLDDQKYTFDRHSLEEAQRLLDCFPDEVFEGPSVPKSVFYPRSK